MTTKQYSSPLMAAIHETAEGLHAAGVMPKRTLREFDELCLTPVTPLTPEDIRSLRQREGISQAVLARHLNITTGLISQWERGEKRPHGVSLKLLPLVKEKGLSSVARRAMLLRRADLIHAGPHDPARLRFVASRRK